MDIKKEILCRINKINFKRDFAKTIQDEFYLSYEQFFVKCVKTAHFLEKQKQDRIVCIMENSMELMILYFAVMLTDKIIVAIDPIKEKAEIQELLSTLKNAYIIVDEVGRRKVDEFHIFLMDEKLVSIMESAISEKSIKDYVLEKLEKRDFNMDYLLTFTSGTSGNTKGVRHSLGNLFYSAYSFGNCFHMTGRTIAHVMPMTYMAGILNSIIKPFLFENKIVIMGRFSPLIALSFWKKIEKENIDLLWLSPSMLTLILQTDKGNIGEKYCTNKDILFLIGTAALMPETRRKFETKYKVKLFASYGLSETLFISTETPSKDAEKVENSVGEILTEVKYKLQLDNEIIIDVPWMFLGYSNENEQKYFEDTFYLSGDLAKLEHGCLLITGRKKDLIVRGGMNISPALIEKNILENKLILECKVFGYKNKWEEESVICAYVLKSNSEENEKIQKSIAQQIINKLGKNYMIDMCFRIESIPKNINGKTDVEKLKEIFEKTHELKVKK